MDERFVYCQRCYHYLPVTVYWQHDDYQCLLNVIHYYTMQMVNSSLKVPSSNTYQWNR